MAEAGTSNLLPFASHVAYICRTGKDATEAFEDVGHSDEARAILPEMLVGNFEGAAVRLTAPRICFTACTYRHLHHLQEKLKAAAYSSSKKGSNAVNNAVESTSKYVFYQTSACYHR